jgi:hypothetical protein
MRAPARAQAAMRATLVENEALCDQDIEIEAINHRNLAPIWICTPKGAF